MAGLFTSGEQDMLGNIVQQRQQANQALGSGYGKYGGIVQAGAALTDVGADAMTGGKIGSADPRMQQLQGAKAIFTKVAQEMGEVNSAAFYEKLSQELAAQYPEQAQKAAEEAVKAKKQGYELGSLERSQNLNEALTAIPLNATTEERVKATNDAIRKFGTSAQIAALTKEEESKTDAQKSVVNRQKALKTAFGDGISDDVALSVAQNSELFTKILEDKYKYREQKTKVITTAAGVKLVKDPSGEVIKDYGAPVSAKTRVEVNLGKEGQSKYAETVGGEVAKKDVAFVNTVDKAAETLPKINETLNILKKGDPTTGIGADVILNVNRIRSQFLKDKKAGKSVTDTQVLDALLGSEVFPMIDALGIGARGLDTPAEREFLRNVFTGTINMDKNTLIKLTETRRKIAERALNKFNTQLNEGYFNNYQEALGRKLKPYDIPQTSETPTTAKGTKYTIIEE